MKLELKRLIVFCVDVPAQAKWYSSVFGMKVCEDDGSGGWADLDGGGLRIGLHGGGRPRTGDCGHKIVFFSKDVEKARTVVIKRGADFGPLKKFGDLHLCDGRDPEGNVLQISNRP